MSTNLAERVANKRAGRSAAAAHRPAQQSTLVQFVQKLRPQIERALPAHVGGADRIARIALTELRRVEHLAECTQESFAGALMTCSALGLEPGGVSGEAYLLPFWNKKIRQYEVQLVVGYQGMIRLFWQHPLAAGLDAHTVSEGDDFEYEYGLAPVLRHKPARGSAKGQPTHYYAVARLANGGSAFVVLDVDDIEAIRKRSKAKDFGPWATDYDAMARKTCVRQLFKLLPKSAELARAVAHDETVRRDPSPEGFDTPGDYIDGEVVKPSVTQGEEQPTVEDVPAEFAGWPEAAESPTAGGE
ncbi:recombinase RecT [Streptomyces rapamycinicus]|uniref:Recombinase RecT n=2 Tax=Streptomyces rapamycinicus TaxID=1226757 RepID=A0A0A0N6Q0_STRRN|nr:recombinase RecT [Streptomyces rapamycinicus]AGP51613.1 recombinase RecT [Streptomyces rapamycinicus NRRL 5491]MBB4784457.1 recombination protein RecT [Streptomyces rapamycinicus]RLV80060.1 recombinase RecT [Streptomyces rapamycinicus NRRL 5491]UTO64765.1 recombinase RecT [Streptomyces rapamycinicus]UTP32722.1 recombinase RecT [Streptomyces rapamycinicus NRRL 5491]